MTTTDTVLADVAAFAERATAAKAAHTNLGRSIANKPIHAPALPEQWEIDALNAAKVAGADAQHRGTFLMDRVAQGIEDARVAGLDAELRTTLNAARATMAAALEDWRVVEQGSRAMLRNAGPAGAHLAAV